MEAAEQRERRLHLGWLHPGLVADLSLQCRTACSCRDKAEAAARPPAVLCFVTGGAGSLPPELSQAGRDRNCTTGLCNTSPYRRRIIRGPALSQGTVTVQSTPALDAHPFPSKFRTPRKQKLPTLLFLFLPPLLLPSRDTAAG